MQNVFHVVLAIATLSAAYAQDIPAPPGSDSFGRAVAVLANGNIIVTDPFFNVPGGASGAGAVFLYQPDGQLISQLVGSRTEDWVSLGGLIVLPGGHALVVSPYWDNGTAVDAGAVTFIDGNTGVHGIVGVNNSLVGSRTEDRVGAGGTAVLTNGNYVVSSPWWDLDSAVDAGAVTWGSGRTGIGGPVSARNSLTGSSEGDSVGRIVALANGHYVVSSPYWDHEELANVGAVSWGDGEHGLRGAIRLSNSILGSSANDLIGSSNGFPSIVALANGHFVIASPEFDNGEAIDAGAATWVRGDLATSGRVSPDNSLTGTSASDRVGERVVPLTNGNYVVASRQWDRIDNPNAGAVTWRAGNGPYPAAVSPANSLVGVRPDHFVGGGPLIALSQGNYALTVSGLDAVSSAAGMGAVILGSGAGGLSGPTDGAIGLMGSNAGDEVGSGLFALANGHYVVTSSAWSSASVQFVGAVTWRDGNVPSSTIVSAANSLVGTSFSDQAGSDGVVALANGHYVVSSSRWNNGSAAEAGAVTWGQGYGGTVGPISPANSLVGATTNDQLGAQWAPVALDDGNYVVLAPRWTRGSLSSAGAVTWGNGTLGTTGAINPINSLVGVAANDGVGSAGAWQLPGGRYAVISALGNPPASATLCAAGGATVGPRTTANTASGVQMANPVTSAAWDPARARLAVGTVSGVTFIATGVTFHSGFE